MSIPQILIGCDPELFIKDVATDKIVSAHDLLPGTKLEPFPIKPIGAIQVDGVAAEFNIEPSNNVDSFIQYCNSMISVIRQRIGPKYNLVIEPTATFDLPYFKNLPENVRELGCNPDFNAYTGKVNEAPDRQGEPFATAAGHIHIGWDKDRDPLDENHFQDCMVVIKQMDYQLGMISLIWDDDTKRRTLYGKPGAFRVKPYGTEYRTLSNKWLSDASYMNYVWNSAYYGMHDLFTNKRNWYESHGDLAKYCIENNVKWWLIDEVDKHWDNLKQFKSKNQNDATFYTWLVKFYQQFSGYMPVHLSNRFYEQSKGKKQESNTKAAPVSVNSAFLAAMQAAPPAIGTTLSGQSTAFINAFVTN